MIKIVLLRVNFELFAMCNIEILPCANILLCARQKFAMLNIEIYYV